MKIAIALTLISILFVSACSNAPQEKSDTQESKSVQSYNYRCKSGETVTVTYHSTDSATIQYRGRSYNMQIAVSGSGARYVGDGLEWWTKSSDDGSEGTLFHHLADGTTGENIEVCTEY